MVLKDDIKCAMPQGLAYDKLRVYHMVHVDRLPSCQIGVVF